jgi:hypothetical protein
MAAASGSIIAAQPKPAQRFPNVIRRRNAPKKGENANPARKSSRILDKCQLLHGRRRTAHVARL